MSSPRTRDMRKIPEPELQLEMTEVLQHLREWLLTKTDVDIEDRYRRLGTHWAWQGVTLADCCWTLALTKDYLWEFLQRQVFARNVVEIYGEMELRVLLDQFFDRALCYMVEGYEHGKCPNARNAHTEPSCPEVNMAAWVT